MHCTADFCMRHYAGFSQIGSQFLESKEQNAGIIGANSSKIHC